MGRLGLDLGLAAVTLALLASGCRIQPIYAVHDHPIPSVSRGLTTKEITQLMADAARNNGWTVDPIGPRELRATQRWRSHAAIVRITHDDRTFAIRNEGSTNLGQHEDEAIHRAYNRRVQALEAAIERRLHRPS